MIRTGRTQELTILRRTPEGLLLGDGEGAEVLLPSADRAAKDIDGRTVRVFIYRDGRGERRATTRPPKAEEGGFAQYRVQRVERDAAYLDMGLPVPLPVPRDEQERPLQEGRWYLVRVLLDPREDRLYGSTRIQDFLSNERLTVQRDDAVDLIVFDRSALGLAVIVNGVHQGLVHANEVFRHIAIGDRITGHVKNVRPDHKLDITLQPIGYRRYNDANTELLAKRLRANNGFLALTDHSPPDLVSAELGISKKAFKQALGALYRERLVRLTDEGIVWIGEGS